MSKQLHPIVCHLRDNWSKSFTIQQLVNLGYGDKHYVHYWLNNSKYVYRVKRGVYKFTSILRSDNATCEEALIQRLKEHPKSTMNELIWSTGYAEQTIRKVFTKWEKDNTRKLKRERVYSLE